VNTFKIPRAYIGSVLLPALWLVIAALAANAVWLTAFAQPQGPTPEALSRAGAPVAARTPYTVVLQESTRGPSGDVSLQGTMTIALRRDGAFVVRYEHLGTPAAVIQRTIELPTGVTIVVDDVRERRTSTRTRVGMSSRARMDPTQSCIKNDSGELVFPGQIVSDRDLVAGYDTVKIKSGDSTFWFARQMGCANVKSSTRLSEVVLNEKVATLIAPGDPDGALFYVPDRYTEVPPSVFHQLDPNSHEAHTLDRSYFERRPRR
jgi:hypothetical protein